MDNHHYNLMKAVVKRSQMVSKYDQNLKDSTSCPECQKMWQKLKEMDMNMEAELRALLTDHLKNTPQP